MDEKTLQQWLRAVDDRLAHDPVFKARAWELDAWLERHPGTRQVCYSLAENNPGAALAYLETSYRNRDPMSSVVSWDGVPARITPRVPPREPPVQQDVALARAAYAAEPSKRNAERFAHARLRQVIPPSHYE